MPSALSIPTSAGWMDANCEVVRWSRHSLGFEISSRDAALMQQAATIFHPWRCDENEYSRASLRWHVEKSKEVGEKWEIRCEGEDAVMSAPTLQCALFTVEFDAVRRLIEYSPPALILHGALLSRDGRGVLIIGPAEAGKSTLACALWQRGWNLLGDNTSLIEPPNHARSSPRRVSLRSASRLLLGETLWRDIESTPSYAPTGEGCLFHPFEMSKIKCSETLGGSTSLVAIIFLARRGAALEPAQKRALNKAQALLALWPYCNLHQSLNFGEMLVRLQPLADTVPSYDLGRSSLDEMARSIEALAT